MCPSATRLLDDRGVEARSVVGDGQHDPVAAARTARRCTVVAPACLWTLASSSRAARYSSGCDSGLPTSSRSASTASRRESRTAAPTLARAGVRPSWASTCGCSSVTVERSPVAVSLQRRVDHVERGIGDAFAHLVEFQPRGQQRLQRAVVQVLGHFPVAPLVGLHRLGHQLAAHLLQCRDARRPSRQHQAQRRRRDRQPQQEAELRVDDVRQADVSSRLE